MPAWAIAILVFGGNFTLWGTVGLFRLIDQMITHLRRRRGAPAEEALPTSASGLLVSAAGLPEAAAAPDAAALPEAAAAPEAAALPGASEAPPDVSEAPPDPSDAPPDASDALPGEAPPEPSDALPGEAPPEPSDALPDADEAPPVPAVAQADAAVPGKAVPARQPIRSIVDMPATPPADELTAPLPAVRLEAEPQPAGELTLPQPALPVSVADAMGDIDRRGAGAQARLSRARSGELARRPGLTVDDVAVVIPAHNEAVVIEDSIRAVLKLVPAANVHVVSDGSTDDTYEIAISTGVQAITTHRNVGKAGALQEAIQRLRIVERFSVVMLLDADTRVQAGYFDAALPMFDDPRVVAVAGCVKTTRDRKLSGTGNLLVGHRQRIYSVGQRVMKFGQTWQRTNATHIVPGFASLYRTDVLPQMEMNPPGLVIEDFNMTFEVYQKRLGKVGFSLSAIAVTQDPVNFHDYLRQTRRWALGLWQTVKRHPPRANLFSAMLALLLLELVTASLLFLMLPVVLLILAVPYLDAATLALPGFGTVHAVVAAHMSLRTVLLGVGLPDYAMTILAAIVERQPRLLLYGLLFPVLRVVDAAVGISAIPMAWLARSTGRWKSPARRREPHLEQVPGDEESVADAAAAAEVEPASVSAAR